MKSKQKITIGVAVLLLAGAEAVVLNHSIVKSHNEKVDSDLDIRNIKIDSRPRVVHEDEHSITIERDFLADEFN